jgi:hypothetical protein
MELEDFAPLIQLCAAFNFSYSAIDNFSKTIEMFVSDPFQNVGKKSLTKFSKKVQSLLDNNVLKDTTLNTKTLKDDLGNSLVDLDTLITKFLTPENYDMQYGVKFKGLYLLAGFFSFFLLFITGVTGVDKYCPSDKIYDCLFIIDCCVLIVSLYILFSTISKKIPKVSLLAIVIIFGIIIALFKVSYTSVLPIKLYTLIPSKDFTIFFTVLLVMIPFFLHFIRVLIQFTYIQAYIFFLWLLHRNKLKAIELKVNAIHDAKKALEPYITTTTTSILPP